MKCTGTDFNILGFVTEHAGKDPVSFHMPGHKGSEIFKRYGYGDILDRLIDLDITEIEGADNLFQPEGIIKNVQDRYAKAYGVKNSYLLVNGTSGGIIASILATVRPGRKLIMARNCHKSAFNGLVLAGGLPVYASPEYIDEYGISGAVKADEIRRLLDENPDADAVILPSPNYYGIVSDIKGIADVVHEKEKILIVDQAHGAHLKFFSDCGYDLPVPAEEAGADITINSIHKTLASVTQSAVLNVDSDLVDRYVLEDKLQMIETSSPSYIMMSFLDINCEILEKHKQEVIGNWYGALDDFYDSLKEIKGLKVMNGPDMDRTKVNIDMSEHGLDGSMLEKELIKRNIYPELYAGNIVMLMTGIGNTSDDYDKTIEALKDIGSKYQLTDDQGEIRVPKAPEPGLSMEIPKEKEMISLDDAAGRVCAMSVIPYPPGIPLVCPGEVFTDEAIEYIGELRSRGEKVIGVNDEGMILAGKII